MAFQYPITAFFSALYVLLLIYYMGQVGMKRMKFKVSLGDGTYQILTEQLDKNHRGDEEQEFNPRNSRYYELNQHIRAHANYVENMPIILLLAFIAEANDAPNTNIILYVTLSVFFVARVLHGFGILSKKAGASLSREIGIGVTLLCYLVLGGLNVYSFARSFK